MTTDADESKLDELDRLLNDPNSPMDPSKVWQLLAEMSQQKPGLAPLGATTDPRH